MSFSTRNVLPYIGELICSNFKKNFFVIIQSQLIAGFGFSTNQPLSMSNSDFCWIRSVKDFGSLWTAVFDFLYEITGNGNRKSTSVNMGFKCHTIKL